MLWDSKTYYTIRLRLPVCCLQAIYESYRPVLEGRGGAVVLLLICRERESMRRGGTALRESSLSIFQSVQCSIYALHLPLGILPSKYHYTVKGRYGFLFLFRFITPLLYTRKQTQKHITMVEQGQYENELNGVSRFVGWTDNVQLGIYHLQVFSDCRRIKVVSYILSPYSYFTIDTEEDVESKWKGLDFARILLFKSEWLLWACVVVRVLYV